LGPRSHRPQERVGRLRRDEDDGRDLAFPLGNESLFDIEAEAAEDQQT
jgi:hypothetical protein